MRLQSFSVNSTKPQINVSNSINLQKKTNFNKFSRNFNQQMNYGESSEIDYNNVLPGQDQSYYETIANRMIEDIIVGVNDPKVNRENTRIFQSAIDFLADHGGGTLNMPAGEIYFGQGGTSGLTSDGEMFAILCRSNVHIKGAGTSGANATIFKPVRVFNDNEKGGMDMFFFNHYAAAGFPKGVNENYKASYVYTTVEGNVVTLENDNFYLTNADFSDFVIDSSNNAGIKDGKHYTTSGKGFMINLMKDCDWNNVVVKDTDATGFGMDCPINCTITNCVAIGCGKQACETDGGASGFGIGTGYANNESIVISNCKSYNNTKYGIFFEHQSRFQSDTTRYPATASNGFLVTNCESGGNLYDFGGIKAYDVTFRNVRSVSQNDVLQNSDSLYRNSGALVATPVGYNSTYSNLIGSNLVYNLDRTINNDYTQQHLYFSDFSTNCRILDSYLCNNITDFGPYKPEITWALNSGIIEQKNTNEFGSKDTLSRMDVMQILYKYNGMPNGVDVTGRRAIGEQTFSAIQNYSGNGNNFNDLQEYAKESGGLDSVLWGVNNGIVMPANNFNPTSVCSRSQVITMLYRMAGSPKVSGDVPFTDIDSNSWYSDALTWAYNSGIIKGISATEFAPNRDLTKEEMAIILSRYTNNYSTSTMTI